MRALLVSILILLLWGALFFFGSQFLETPQWVRLGLIGCVVAVVGAIAWWR